MSEVLVMEKKIHSGEFRLYVDRDKKLVKRIVKGIFEPKEYEEGTEAVINEIKKFKKGEPLFYGDSSGVDMRLMSSENMKIVNSFSSFGASYCKKFAHVIPSFVLRKGVEGVTTPNLKLFDNEHSALEWLFKD